MDELQAKMHYIDYVNKKRIWIELQDQEGNSIDLKETTETILQWISDKMKKEAGLTKTLTEIFPLAAQLLAGGIEKSAGYHNALFILSNQTIRYTVLQQMMLMHYFEKFIAKNNLKILSMSEPITEEDIQQLLRVDKANSVTAMSSMMGINPKDAVKMMYDSGNLTEEDIKLMEFDIEDFNKPNEESNVSTKNSKTNKGN